MNVSVNTGQVGMSISGGLGGSNSSNRRSYKSNMTLQPGVWTHLVFIFRDYNDMDIYFDCVKSTGTGSGTGSTNMVYSNTESRIGSDIGNNGTPNGSYFDGSLDGLAIWERELQENEFHPLCEKNVYLNIKELENTEERLNVSIYPNPVNDILNIKVEDSFDFSIVILDNLGIQVSKINSKKESVLEINTSSFEKGVYTVIISSNEKVISRKFVKI